MEKSQDAKRYIVPQLWVLMRIFYLEVSRYCILGLLHCNALKPVILASTYFEWLHSETKRGLCCVKCSTY